MSRIALAVVVHVSNVWQTCEWYRRVFDIDAEINADATKAHLLVANQRLALASFDSQTETFGSRRVNSFLDNPAALHLDLTVVDVRTSPPFDFQTYSKSLKSYDLGLFCF